MKATIEEIRRSLSPARLQRYERSAQIQHDACTRGLELYIWNAQVSGSFMMPLHICEVTIRNAASEALTNVYGDRWPWSVGFEQSLPDPANGYSPKKDLQSARRRAQTTGKAIPEFNFVFWQKMFTRRHDQRLWDPYLLRVIPSHPLPVTARTLRQKLYTDLENVRLLRNRIAHHEPIYNRDLKRDLECIVELVRMRSEVTADWLTQHEKVSEHLDKRPV